MTDSTPNAPKLKKVLVPYNFTKRSELALDFSLEYCQKMLSDIYLFHVFRGSSKDYRRIDRLNEEYMERMKQVVIMAIDRMQAQGLQPTVKDVHRRVSTGKPGVEILKVCAGISADMIVMGAPKNNDFKKLILRVPCSLVLVKEKDPTFVV